LPVADATALASPPEGCAYSESIRGDLTITASLRSVGSAVAYLAFALFWNGIVSIFVLFAISQLYAHFIGPVPTWFPAPRSNRGGVSTVGETYFLCIFLIPFVLVGAGMIMAVIYSLIGRVQLTVTGTDGRVRTGCGPINWSRRFDASKVKRVSDTRTKYEVNHRTQSLIQIEAERTIRFGSGLSDPRRKWLLGMLHFLLVAPTKAGREKLGLLSLDHKLQR
jgi:hypothetical protein